MHEYIIIYNIYGESEKDRLSCDYVFVCAGIGYRLMVSLMITLSIQSLVVIRSNFQF